MEAPDPYLLLDQNRVLRAIPPDLKSDALARLQSVATSAGEVVYEPGDSISAVYFPTTAVLGLMNVMEDGESVEVAISGHEAMLGTELIWGRATAFARVTTLIPGHAFKMTSETFKESTSGHDRFRGVLHACAQALMVQIFQSAGCNRLHSVEERCGCWLLRIYDRAKSDNFPLTQEMLSQMLGVRRQSVGVVADSLQKAGLIRYSRGKIQIRSRKGLEMASCECYRRVKEELDRLLGLIPPSL
jgi:CRP-like cAMP-binding protein